jgi:hypothetical protein
MAGFKRPTAFYLFEGYSGVAEVHLDRLEAGDASPATKQAARQACAALRRFARIYPIGRPRARLLGGRLRHLAGRRRRARAAWRASLSAAQRLGMPFDTALAHAELGRYATSEPQRLWHLERARTLLDELGISDDSVRPRTPRQSDQETVAQSAQQRLERPGLQRSREGVRDPSNQTDL